MKTLRPKDSPIAKIYKEYYKKHRRYGASQFKSMYQDV